MSVRTVGTTSSRATMLVVASVALQEGGAALAVGLFAWVGPTGAVLLRFAGAGLILTLLVRPRLRGLSPAQWKAVTALTASLTVMNFCFYQAVSRVPLGLVVTVEILGPLILSVVVGRRWMSWLWAGLSLVGVTILGASGWGGHADYVGFAFAAVAAASWACYILAGARAAPMFAPMDALALASCLGAVALAPMAVIAGGGTLTLNWAVVGLGLAVALTCSVLPYSFELLALRSLPSHAFAVLTSLSPVVAAISGWLLLDQRLGGADWVAIGCVTAASVGAVQCGRRKIRPKSAPSPRRPTRVSAAGIDTPAHPDRLCTCRQ
ncbi:EamA family transporter [Mycolicibacterium sp. BiH015]|uniref:EamA family transporter n=1 Tax=Mycolicibacterium sp. BiH015 TaxID=3018808 RepID=UPI0022E556F0|nr:EamA family transporter [Mycolicibacterium sp. BiH015]MDA2893287.1 EamA family transporter [Mycolicibacterium sp. BiH015]